MASSANPAKPGPAAPRLIQRAALVAALDRAAETKVTLISAPAGSGKTSLLRAWAAGPGQRYRLAVVQVQRDQQDSQQFWLAVLSAVRQASGTPVDGEQLAATPDFNEATAGEWVLSELAEHRERTFLVIDDLHELTSPDALLQLTRLLERGLSEAEGRRRIAAQCPTDQKAARADFVIRTDRSIAETDAEVEDILRRIQ